jgi:hypothetical protein
MLQHLRQQARRELLAESRKHPITAKLRQIPSLGPIRSALAVALIQTPHRFRTKRQLWAYSGLALETRTSGEHCYVQGQLRRSKKQVSIRGLNKDHNHDLKGLFKAAATRASVQPGPFQDFYQASLAKGIKPTMVRLTLAEVRHGTVRKRANPLRINSGDRRVCTTFRKRFQPFRQAEAELVKQGFLFGRRFGDPSEADLAAIRRG